MPYNIKVKSKSTPGYEKNNATSNNNNDDDSFS